ncbi:Uncharacterised protein [Vibrio cholerae]|uniref:Uncharacterized protein n=1 Tax=Vibrio cholerae TaxID=666 RepID=A0A655WYJ7_VIBCL|nr:Uncharacterised protein [Vibrio cholerae]
MLYCCGISRGQMTLYVFLEQLLVKLFLLSRFHCELSLFGSNPSEPYPASTTLAKHPPTFLINWEEEPRRRGTGVW